MRKFYLFLAFFVALIVAGCSKVEIYNPNYFKQDTVVYSNLPKLVPTFVLCQEIFANNADVQYEANLACATIKRKAKLVKRQFLNTCYFLAPISNTYECVEYGDEDNIT